MTVSNPDIRISIRCEGPLVITFTRSNQPDDQRADQIKLDVRTKVSPLGLAEFRQDVSNALNMVRRWSAGREVELDLKRACDIMREFIRIQGGNSSVLFHRDDRVRIQNFFRQACPAWQRCGTDGYRAPTVQVTGSVDHMLPVEFLPLFDAATCSHSENDLGHLCEMAAQFPGFSTIVHRSLLEKVGSTAPVELENVDKLRIRFFQHAGTKTAREGYASLSNISHFEILGPWPDGPLARSQFIHDLASSLWQGGGPAAAGAPVTSDHVQYFACHCDTQQPNSGDYSLRLAHNSGLFAWGAETIVKLRDLHQAFGGFPARQTGGPLPLIFLNACGGSRMSPTSVTSFPRFFLDNDNCAVIATETPVQDNFAEAFAREFYQSLRTVTNCGEALFHARWSLLKHKHNPQGILYSSYGNPDVRLRRPGV